MPTHSPRPAGKLSRMWQGIKRRLQRGGTVFLPGFAMYERARRLHLARGECRLFALCNVGLAAWHVAKHFGYLRLSTGVAGEASAEQSIAALYINAFLAAYVPIAISAMALQVMKFLSHEALARQLAGRPVSASVAMLRVSYLVPIVQFVAPPILLHRLTRHGSARDRKRVNRSLAIYWILLAASALSMSIVWPLVLGLTGNWTVTAVEATGYWASAGASLLVAGSWLELRRVLPHIGRFPVPLQSEDLPEARRGGAFAGNANSLAAGGGSD